MLPDTDRVDLATREARTPASALGFHARPDAAFRGRLCRSVVTFDLLQQGGSLTTGALASLGLAGVSLAASTLHLGRPIYAWRALKGLRRSWLSREVLTLSLFAGAANAFAAMLMFNLPMRPAMGLCTVLAGLAGRHVFSAHLYCSRAPRLVQQLYICRILFDGALSRSVVRTDVIDAHARRTGSFCGFASRRLPERPRSSSRKRSNSCGSRVPKSSSCARRLCCCPAASGICFLSGSPCWWWSWELLRNPARAIVG